jgi:hypothetical protein
MEKSNEYRVNAAYCQRMADGVPREDEKHEWSTLAQYWLRLARPRHHSETGASEAKVVNEVDGPKENR